MARRSEDISPTAHYTGYTWYHHGLSHPAFVTPQGRFMVGATRPLHWMAQAVGAPTLSGFLLARHRVIDHLLHEAIDAGQVSQVIEIAAGLSPRGWAFKQRHGVALTYIEADLPHMARRKQRLLAQAGLASEGHRVVALDALATSGEGSLSALADSLDPTQGLAIVTEGLLNYFDQAAVLGMWQRFAQTLGRFPHGLYLSDMHLAHQNAGAHARGFVAMLSAFVRGRVHLHFQSDAEALAALRHQGFAAAALHDPRVLLARWGQTAAPGAGLVRVIQASTASP
ncbi:MAG TPA: class I SAM-dependent methyltransferase [Aquabacterium sp.]|uniref:class I SAM-dependent methyltransferase n=1 Tax=Aquabacterium sp. TaxID=1872578 RepID=UPI002E2EFB0F|nr:class I SAM-dependent methyltransferase [Aquabacterium sp.]HEX5371961.1 class I SAM-dependent methyltransferase [Aquabacterium sp.]